LEWRITPSAKSALRLLDSAGFAAFMKADEDNGKALKSPGPAK
jgi:hypothetical protein